MKSGKHRPPTSVTGWRPQSLSKESIFIALTFSATVLLKSPLRAVTSCGTDFLRAGTYSSPVWTAGFKGSLCREFSPDRLKVDLRQDEGRMDTSVRGEFPSVTADRVHPDTWVRATCTITNLHGKGRWWIGPKFSFRKEGTTSLVGNFENYVVENASRSPAQYHETFSRNDRYIGTTTHDGAQYRHYRVPRKSWTQFWAIRQKYRTGGAVHLKPIVAMWRKNGMRNDRARSCRFWNMETSGTLSGTFTFTDFYIPDDFSKAPDMPCPGDDPVDCRAVLPSTDFRLSTGGQAAIYDLRGRLLLRSIGMRRARPGCTGVYVEPFREHHSICFAGN